MAGMGEKLGMDPQIGQPARWGLCQEPFFSRAATLSIAVEDFAKGCHVRGPPQEAYAGRTWTDVGSVRVVWVEFSPAGCTLIRIAATLEYE
jgi:hypothetical protein